MSKGNQAMAGKMVRQASLYSNGTVLGDKYVTQYDQGRNAYDGRQPYRECSHPHWQQGWRAGRDNDMKLLAGGKSQAYRDTIAKRILEMMNKKPYAMVA